MILLPIDSMVLMHAVYEPVVASCHRYDNPIHYQTTYSRVTSNLSENINTYLVQRADARGTPNHFLTTSFAVIGREGMVYSKQHKPCSPACVHRPSRPKLQRGKARSSLRWQRTLSTTIFYALLCLFRNKNSNEFVQETYSCSYF